MKKALIFGGTGQMGSYLREYLQSLGSYNVVSLSSVDCDFRADLGTLNRMFQGILENEEPDEIYNFASKMHAEDSWWGSTGYLMVNGMAVQALLANILTICPKAKFFNSGSADMFYKWSTRQDERTPKIPANPHALSKLLAFDTVQLYRYQKGLFAVTGIFFNAESPRRAKTFFANKVISEAVRLKKDSRREPIALGSLSGRRDWGWAPEYVQVAWQMLQQEAPVDLVIGTGESHTCREFVAEALTVAGLPDVENRFDEYVSYQQDEHLYQAYNHMLADPALAKKTLGWEAKYKMKDVIRMLVEAEITEKAAVA